MSYYFVQKKLKNKNIYEKKEYNYKMSCQNNYNNSSNSSNSSNLPAAPGPTNVSTSV